MIDYILGGIIGGLTAYSASQLISAAHTMWLTHRDSHPAEQPRTAAGRRIRSLFGSFGMSSPTPFTPEFSTTKDYDENRICISYADGENIRIAAEGLSDRLTALTKYGLSERDFEQIFEKAERFKRPLADWFLRTPGCKSIEFLDEEVLDGAYKAIKKWSLKDCPSTGLDEK